MAYDAAPLDEQECYDLLIKRFGDVRKSVEGRNQEPDVPEDEGLTDSEIYERDSDEYISNQIDAGNVASLKNYYQKLSAKNQDPSAKNQNSFVKALERLKSDAGGGINTAYSPLGINFFMDLLESKPQRTDAEEKAYELVKLQARIFNTDDSVWEKVLEDRKDEFAWVKRAADYDDELYKDPFILCYGGTLKIEHGIDGKDAKKAALLDFLREHNVPMPEKGLREWAESIISTTMMYIGTPMPSTGTSIIGMHLYEKNHLVETGLDNFITSSIEFGKDSPFECIQITEGDGSYLVRSFSVKTAEASDYDRRGNLKLFSNLAGSKTLSELTQYLLSKEMDVYIKNEKIEPIETFDDDLNFRFVLDPALLPVS